MQCFKMKIALIFTNFKTFRAILIKLLTDEVPPGTHTSKTEAEDQEVNHSVRLSEVRRMVGQILMKSEMKRIPK